MYSWHLSRADEAESTYIKITPSDENVLYASVRYKNNYDLLKSVDRGASWSSLRNLLPEGLDINWISISKTNSNIILVSIWNNGIYLSKDAGNSWKEIFDSQFPRSVEIDPTDSNKIYVGIGGNNDSFSGLYITSDEGNSWTKVSIQNRNNAQIAISPFDSNIVFADFDPYFYKSVDGGNNWELTNLRNAYSHSTLFDPDDPNVLYAGSYSNSYGMYKSIDGGITWNLKSNGFTGGPFQISQTSRGKIFISSFYPNGGVWMSDDKAETWQNISDPSWGNRGVWGLDAGNGRVFASVEGLGLFYADIPEQSPNPVVVIPGFGASWSYKGLIKNRPTTYSDWQLLPVITDSIYKPLINAFVSSGLKENENLFVYAYDFRKSITDNSNTLKQYLETVVVPKNDGKKINLVGHSMGGLVIRNCVEKISGCASLVDKIVTVGSPHNGSLKAYKLWEGGVVDDDNVVTRTIEELAIRALNPLYFTRKDIIQNNFLSVKDFLPIFDYIYNKPYKSMSQGAKNTNLESLEPKTNFFTGNLLAVSGNFLPTDKEFTVIPASPWESILGLWEDGKPQSSTMDLGDKTVLSSSSQVLNQSYYTSTDHTSYFADISGVNRILDHFKLAKVSQLETPTIISSILGFVIHSPAEISVLDSNGNNVGINSEKNTVFIINPGKGNYDVKLRGTGNGSYVLESIFADAKKVTTDTNQGKITVGETKTLKISLSDNEASLKTNQTIDDYYYSIVNRLSNFSGPTKNPILRRISLALGKPFSPLDLFNDDGSYEENQLRFDNDQRAIVEHLIRARIRLTRLLANQKDKTSRNSLYEANENLLQLILLANPKLVVTKEKIVTRINDREKAMAAKSMAPRLTMNQSVNFQTAYEYLSRAKAKIATGNVIDKTEAYFLILALPTFYH